MKASRRGQPDTSAAAGHHRNLVRQPPTQVPGHLTPLLLIASLCIVAGTHSAPLLLIASLCIVAGTHSAPLLLIASLCIVAGAHSAPLLLIASLCIVAGAHSTPPSARVCPRGLDDRREQP